MAFFLYHDPLNAIRNFAHGSNSRLPCLLIKLTKKQCVVCRWVSWARSFALEQKVKKSDLVFFHSCGTRIHMMTQQQPLLGLASCFSLTSGI